jgi:hypothetical protein
MGRAARCGLADGEGRSDRDGEGMISGVSIAVAARPGTEQRWRGRRLAAGNRERCHACGADLRPRGRRSGGADGGDLNFCHRMTLL